MPSRHDRRALLRRTIRLASAGFALPLLAACDQLRLGSAPTPAAAAPATAKSVAKVSYAFASVNGLHFIATVGAEKPDLAHQYGIEFDLLTTTNSPNAVNAVVGGSVDVAGVTPDSAWPAQDKAPELKQLLPIADGTPYVIIGQPELKRAADLKGKTIGASALRGGADILSLRIIMAENGITENDYTVVQSGAISDRTAAMKARAIDAVSQLEPQATLLRDEGFVEIDNANNYPALKGVHTIVLLSRTNWYQGNADTAANFVRAWDGLTRWIYDAANKDEVLAIAKKTMGANDKSALAVYNLHVSSKSVSPVLRINEKYMQQFIDNQKKTGAEGLPADAMKYVDSSLVTRVLGL
ncbi:MAG TPA: ABC transporter substrate-binding protein [Chloroflexota bacterium]|jgi:ABC-type nitrate/sulfonate/bicarbonate transport system substrate-binding protein|nr:ABC transporter substrate-binding protein [Chloroflexota bacterium]